MAKSPDAFRTISEVADWLGIQAHVLRFWESKFTQVKPIKRAGGRRYYRPADMLLLGGIKKLLHDDGLTIKGVQKILREEGMSYVVDMSAPLDELTMSQLGDDEPAKPSKPATAVTTPEEEKGVVLNFESAAAPKPEDEAPEAVDQKEEPADTNDAEADVETADSEDKEPQPEDAVKAAEEAAPEPTAPIADAPSEPAAETTSADTASESESTSAPETQDAKSNDKPASTDDTPAETEEPAPVAALPAFLRRPLADQDEKAVKPDVPAKPEVETAPAAQSTEPEPAPEPAKKPRIIDVPAFTAEADFPSAPAMLTSAFRARKIAPADAAKAANLLQKLTVLRDSMAARRRGATPPPSQD
ncbi:MAG: MerR family transcriptional regulator [Sulfitobacter sp.]